VLAVVQTDAFRSAWLEANRIAHEQLVAVLTGDESSTSLRVQGDTVSVDLGAFLTVVKERLVSRGFALAERIPAVDAQFVLFQSDQVTRVQRAFRVLDTLGFWLPPVCVILVGSGVLLARNRRRAFLLAGLGVAVAMLVTGLGLTAARQVYLDSVPPDVLSGDAAASAYDTLVRFLRDAVRALGLVGLIVALMAFVAGPSRAAVTIRRWIDTALGAAKGGVASLGLDLAPVTRWVAPHAQVLRGAVLAVAFVALFLQPYRSPGMIGKAAVAVLVALAIVQFLAVPPRHVGGGDTRGPVPEPAVEPVPAAPA
jgi:hypothetical protein